MKRRDFVREKPVQLREVVSIALCPNDWNVLLHQRGVYNEGILAILLRKYLQVSCCAVLEGYRGPPWLLGAMATVSTQVVYTDSPIYESEVVVHFTDDKSLLVRDPSLAGTNVCIRLASTFDTVSSEAQGVGILSVAICVVAGQLRGEARKIVSMVGDRVGDDPAGSGPVSGAGKLSRPVNLSQTASRRG